VKSNQSIVAVMLAGSTLFAGQFPLAVSAQDATPAATYRCEDVEAGQRAGTPGTMMPGGMAMMGTPMAGMDSMMMEHDQMYIDMMIPHHQSIIALAEAATPRLTDERLQEIAAAIIETQGAEIEELRGYRESFYGDANPMPINGAMMTAMHEMMMPGMANAPEAMKNMAFQMDAMAQVATFCAAEDADLAFIDLVIPHHQMAIESSQATLQRAVHREIRDVAQRVIDAQEREIEELTEFRDELAPAATPAS